MDSASLRKLRMTAGLSQRLVADRVGINQAVLSQIETGLIQPTPELAETIIFSIWQESTKRAQAVEQTVQNRPLAEVCL